MKSDVLAALKDSLKSDGQVKARVAGESMLPLLKTGDRVTIYPLDPAELQRFDTLLFFNDDRWVIHYFWHFNEIPDASGERVLITRGLNTSCEDLPVLESQILGIAREVRIPVRLRLREVIRYWLRR